MSKKIMSDSAIMSARYGTYTVNSATTITDNFVGVRIDADAVITLKNRAGTDVTANYVSDGASAVVANTLILAEETVVFSEIVVTSGQVTLIKTRIQ